MPPPLATVLPVRLGWAVVLVGVGAALAAAAGVPARATYGARVTADEPQYLLTAISLAEDHDLDISDELRQERWRPFHEALLPQQSEVQRDGSELSPHDPLLPAILAVPVALGGWIGAKLAIAVIAGILAGLLVWVAVRRFAVPVRPAAVVVGVFAITPPLTVYGAQIYPELPAALALTVVIAAATGPLTTRGRIAATLGVVALPWLSVKYVPVAAVLAALVLWLVHARLGAAPALAVGAVLAVMGAGYLTFHHLVYGGWTVYAAGSHFAGGELTVAGEHPRYLGRSSRLLGLLTDRTYGLAAWAPAYILTVGALAALARRRPPGWLVLVLPVVAGWLTATFVALTMHGVWWPGRQVVVVLPALVLATAWWVGRAELAARWRAGLAALGGLAVVTWVWVLVDVLRMQRRLVVDVARDAGPVQAVLRMTLPDYRHPSAGTWARHLAWLAVVAFVAAAGWYSLDGRSNDQDHPSTARRSVPAGPARGGVRVG